MALIGAEGNPIIVDQSSAPGSNSWGNLPAEPNATSTTAPALAALSYATPVVSVCNGNGQAELFNIATDGTVWNYYPDPSSDTGFSGVSTGLSATTIAAATLAGTPGEIILFAGNNTTQISYITRDATNPKSAWSMPQTADTGFANPVLKVIATQVTGGQSAYFAALDTGLNAMGGECVPRQQPNLQTCWGGSPNCLWLGDSQSNVAFASWESEGAVLGEQIWASGIYSSFSLSGAPGLTQVERRHCRRPAGNNRIFAVLSDGNVYQLGLLSSSQVAWTLLNQNPDNVPNFVPADFVQVVADCDGDGNIQVFAVSSDNTLYHFEPNPNSPTGYDQPSPLFTNVALACATANDAGNIELFLVSSDTYAVTHLFQDEVAGVSNWQAQPLEVAGSTIEVYTSYSSAVTLYDNDGALLVNTAVSVTASEQAILTLNGATCVVDPNLAAQTSTNSAGVLYVAQETDTLSAPTITITVSGYPSALVIEQYVSAQTPGALLPLQQTLQNVEGSDLESTTDFWGNPVFQLDATTADSLASACNNCMDLAETPPSLVSPRFRRGAVKPGVWIAEPGPASRRRINPAKAKPWQITFGKNGATYRDLTAEEAAAIVAHKRATLPSTEGVFDDWLSDVGDLLQGAVEGVIQVVNTVVNTVSDGVTALFTIIVNGITYAFNATVDFVEQAFDIVQTFFAQVAVAFEQLVQYLGFLFNWNDMLLTQQAIAYTLNQFLGFLGGAAGGIQGMFDNWIEYLQNLQGQIPAPFSSEANKISGTSTLGGYEQANSPPSSQSSQALSSSVANNPFYNGFVNNAEAATMSSSGLAALDTETMDQVMQQLTKFAHDFESTSEFTSVLACSSRTWGQSGPDLHATALGIVHARAGRDSSHPFRRPGRG